MGIISAVSQKASSVFNRDKDKYELDDEWEKILRQLRREVEDEGFQLEDNEELYVSLLAHIVKENEEGLEMLAREEVAEKARMENKADTTDETSSVKIKTISPQESSDK